MPQARRTRDYSEEHDPSDDRRRHAAYATETFGLLFIAFLLLVLTVVRYWHVIHWSVR